MWHWGLYFWAEEDFVLGLEGGCACDTRERRRVGELLARHLLFRGLGRVLVLHARRRDR